MAASVGALPACTSGASLRQAPACGRLGSEGEGKAGRQPLDLVVPVTQGTSTAPCEGQGRWGPKLCGGKSPTSSAHFSAEACRGEGEGQGGAAFSQFGLLGEGKLREAPYRATQDHSGAVGEAGSLGCHPLHEVCLCTYACASMRAHSSSAGDEPRGQCTGTGLVASGSQKDPKGA